MKIESVAISVPSRKITNEDICNIIMEENKKENQIKVNKYIRLVKLLFKKSGADNRYICDLKNKEKAFEHINKAMKKALKKANMTSSDIDMLIYCGVGKGLIEPANAYFYAHEVGMKNANCFDVVDACMSWIRALEMAYSYQKTGKYHNIMIVNGEFNFPHAASSVAYKLASKDIISPEKMYTRVFPRYGNLVSASIPAGLDLALKEGLLTRGNHIVFLPASAGMVFSVVQFNY